ncbi:MAG TPA: hypothetical protein G4O01_09070 [Dehalococcoidia bacterium]|jgi:hypothetical protein|nr:hypothetical protein [Dehalococcoidia bacterium]
MGKDKEFEDILNECLERMLSRGETIEQCLASYPEQAAELEPLLQTALLAHEALAIKPRPEFRERARYQLRAALQEMGEKRRRFSLFSWQPRWATVVIAVLILLVVSGGTVAAASGSMPDDALYPVKLATEKVRLALTPSALGKAELYAELADRRVAEIVKMADEGKLEQMEQAVQRLSSQLMAMANLVGLGEAQPGVPMAPAPAMAPEAAPEPPARKPGVPVVPPGLKRAPPMREVPEETEVQMVPAPPIPERSPLSPEAEEEIPEEGAELDKQAKLRMIVIRNIARHQEKLRAALERVPGPARPALLRAIAASNAEYERVLKALEEEGRGKD